MISLLYIIGRKNFTMNIFIKSDTNKISLFFYYLFIFLIIGLGLFLRIRLYLTGHDFWSDEFRIAFPVLAHPFYRLFRYLDDMQMAPPLYLCLTKILTLIFGKSIFVFRFISIVSGCLSLILFYLLLVKTFKSKIPILLGLFLFAVNANLIYYSNEFKPYSLDVLCLISLFLIYEKIHLDNKKNIIIWSIIFFILPFFSFASFAALGAILLLKTFEIKSLIKSKNIFIAGIVLFVSALILFMINKPNKYDMVYNNHLMYFPELSISSLNGLLTKFLDYMQCYSFVSVLMLYFGIILAFLNKNKIIKLLLISLLLLLFASLIKLYPFGGRMILFMTPVFILFIISVMDIENDVNMRKLSIIQSLTLCVILLSSINIKDKFNFVYEGKYAVFGNEYFRRDLSRDEIIKFLDLYKEGEKYIYAGGSAYEERLRHYKIVKKCNVNYNFKENKNFMDYKKYYENSEELSKEKKLKILSNGIKKELNQNKKVNYWISGNIDKELEQENFVENILKEMKLKYKIIATMNGNLYHIER